MKVAGNADISGAIFVDGDVAGNTAVIGNSDIGFDSSCIESALSGVIGTATMSGTPNLISWKEIASSELLF